MTVAPWGNAPPRWHRTALWGRGSYRGVVRLQAELDFEWDQCMFDPALWIYAPLGYERLECTRIFANDPITGLQYTTCTEWWGAWRRGPHCQFFSHPSFPRLEISYGRPLCGQNVEVQDDGAAVG